MKKFFMALAISAIALFSFQESKAQNVIEKGTSIINLGLGGYFQNGNALTVTGAYDYGLNGNLFDSKSALTLGAGASVSAYKGGMGFLVGPRLGLHYHFVPKLDTYLALMLGYAFYTYDDNAIKPNHGGFGWNLALGARYMFTPTLGGFIELGGGYSNVAIGAAFKF